MNEYIIENSELLNKVFNFLYEASLNNKTAIARANQPSGKQALQNLFTGTANLVKTQSNISRNANARVEAERRRLIVGSGEIDRKTNELIGNYMKQFLEQDCIKAGEKLGKMRKKNLSKEIESTVAGIIRNHVRRKDLVDKTRQTIGTSASQKASQARTDAAINAESNPQRLAANYTLEDLNTEQLLKEGYIECENPFYDEMLLEGDYQSTTKKNVKATILTIIVFILSLVITNMVRVYFGGTPGGDFTSDAMKNGFMWFTTLLLAPILEEPAKLIAVKGGYGKHFFFTFNFLEFGLYLMMFMAGGVANLGVAVLVRGIAVLMHAFTTRILGASKGKGFASTTFRLAVSMLIHFAFNALFLKYGAFGISGNALLLFAIGFFGVAFGLFLVSKIGKSNSNSNFTTQGNLEPQWSGY